MPSTDSSVVSRPLASSTVITPSLPTFSIASAIRLPISASLLAEIVPTWAISFLPFVSTASRQLVDHVSTAPSMPRFRSIGLTPAVTLFRPSRIDRLGQHRRGRGAVAGDVGGLRGDFLDHLRAHVLERILELDLPWRR